MSWIHEGTYREQIDSYSHEGYLSETSQGHYSSACACGWVGHGRYEQTPEGEHSVHEEWCDEHLRPMLHAEAQEQPDVPAEALMELTWALRDRAGKMADQHRYQGICDVIEALDDLLDQYAVTDYERTRARTQAVIQGLEPTAWTKLAKPVRDGDTP